MVNKENIQSVEREGEKRRQQSKKSKAQQILRERKKSNYEMYNIDLKEFV